MKKFEEDEIEITEKKVNESHQTNPEYMKKLQILPIILEIVLLYLKIMNN